MKKFINILFEKISRYKDRPNFSGMGKRVELYFQNIQWEDLINNFFSVSGRPIIHKVFVVTALATTSYLGGRTVAISLRDLSNIPDKHTTSSILDTSSQAIQNSIDQITSNNLFNAKKSNVQKIVTIDKEKTKVVTNCTSSNNKTSLPIKLISTTVMLNTIKSAAAIEHQGKLASLRESEKFKDLVKIGKIQRNRVTFRNLKGGKCEYLSNEEKKEKSPTILSPRTAQTILPPSRNSNIRNIGNNFVIKKNYRDELLKDVSKILQQARAVPIKRPDGTLQFKMVEVAPGSIYSHLNIQDGDIITAINGKKTQNINELMALFGKIKELDHIQITYNRDGVEQQSEFDFVE